VSDEDFYDAQSEASQIKTRIVTKYFMFWAKVMVPQARSWARALAYIDLYAGPGRYDDGTKSTPILVLEAAVQNPDLRKFLVTTFNDRNPEFATRLRSNIQKITGIESLVHQPQVHSVEVDEEVADVFGRAALIPSFSFVDPFGYKGITQSLLKGMLKDWGCDLILFFSYARINAAIDNEIFEEHISALFGEDRLRDLRARLQGKRPWEREALILETFSQVLRDLGFKYVLPFTFQRKGQDRTSHHLILVTKHPLGYTVMKKIMAGESSEYDQGVPSFTYSRSLGEAETPLLFSLDRPLELLADDLLEKFEGQSLTMKEVFERHHLGTRYVERNYKTALGRLEVEGKIIANPPAIKRPKRSGERTFGPNVRVVFPQRKKS
jgi:three-Cys-motif partner protein